MSWIAIADLALSFGALLVILWLVIPETAPWEVLRESSRHIWATPRLRRCMGAGLAILALDGIESKWDWPLTRWLGLDFTPLIQRLEGGLVQHFQFSTAPPVIYFFAIFYEIVFSALMFGAPFFYVYRRQERLLQLVVTAYIIEYLVVLPFYIFFPVLETGEGKVFAERLTARISPLLDREIFGYFESSNNCFPSTHTALAVIMALVARESGARRWWLINGVSAVIVVFSTLYLGIHWLLDVLAGLVVGWGVYWGAKQWLNRTAALKEQELVTEMGARATAALACAADPQTQDAA